MNTWPPLLAVKNVVYRALDGRDGPLIEKWFMRLGVTSGPLDDLPEEYWPVLCAVERCAWMDEDELLEEEFSKLIMKFDDGKSTKKEADEIENLRKKICATWRNIARWASLAKRKKAP